MCTVTHYASRLCGHHWLTIRTPCFPGYGFRWCDTFRNGAARHPEDEWHVASACPACTMPWGGYDKNLVRMVLDIQDRWRWGVGPSRQDFGVDCVVM
ncbi:hypothetical protein F5Y15DRAFT_20973 [Xylariaceae sp. FL0016]|nr:hypothetical protein F5Y15DRAFT_20973 [Xylariaceae sp. FL0016]